MKHSFWSTAVLLLFLVSRSGAQAYYFYDDRHYEGPLLTELGIKSGGINALTDLGGKKGTGRKGLKDLNLIFTRPCISFYTILLYKNSVGFRFQYTSGSVTAADSILKNSRMTNHGRYERNLSFRSPVRELAFTVEIHPLSIINAASMNKGLPRLSPFLLGGIGVFSFNPQTRWENRWYPLQPLHTEGQGFSIYPERKPYALQQGNLLLGSGLKYEFNAWLNGRVEFIHRFLKTDYLDDVSIDSYLDPAFFARELPPSLAKLALVLADRRAEVDPGHITNTSYQRGNPHNKDGYFTVEIGLGIVLGRRRR